MAAVAPPVAPTQGEVSTSVNAAVSGALTTLAKDSSNSLDQADVSLVTKVATDQIAPIIANATNQEPFWQSRIFWGLVVTLLASVAMLTGHAIAPDDQKALIDTVTGIAGGAGQLIIIYGRFIANTAKPLGQ